MDEHHQSFKRKANNPPEGYYRGIKDCVNYYRHWYTKNKTLKRSGVHEFEPVHCEWDDWYCNGWAEGNISAYTMWLLFWKYGDGSRRGVIDVKELNLNNRLN